jgi:tRNA C32,U32 (ribose-2'-O)-methylase TrmJ
MKLPKWFNGDVYEEGGTVTNPFTNEEVVLTNEELSMYDLIKGAEMLRQYEIMNKALAWFKEANPEAYLLLLD